MLEYGACLGRHFNPDHVFFAIKAHNEEEIDSILKYCQESGILRLNVSPHIPGFLEFDHDLIREVIIDTMSTHRHQAAARRLLDYPGVEKMSRWEQACLWFQAGDAQKVLDLTHHLLYVRGTNAPEVLKSALLCLLVTQRHNRWDIVNTIPFIGWDSVIQVDRAPNRPVPEYEDNKEMLKAAEVIFDKLQFLSSTAVNFLGRLASVCELTALQSQDKT